MSNLTFVIGYDFEEFRNYYKTLKSLHDYYKELAIPDVIYGDLGPTGEAHIKKDPTHLIIWMENEVIVGHAVWHEGTTDDYKEPSEKEARVVLENLLANKKDFIELHEVWLKDEHRGKGYGDQFFEFFEEYIGKRFGRPIIHFADNPASNALCRKRGYTEDWMLLDGESWRVFCLHLTKTTK
ncbi:MAG: GNAT family N-acetyltransferase [Candidatus Thorarchaeota archaeon]|jgi:GNAT superfamily N-acetyltransferase